MSLYLIVTGDFVRTGGMDRANHALAHYLARRGDEVHLVAHRVAPDLLDHQNVIFHAVPLPFGSRSLGVPLLDRAGRYWAGIVARRGGRVIVNGGNCRWADVNWVHYVHAAHTPEVVGSLTRRLATGWKHHTFLRNERNALHRPRVVLANSERTRRDLVERVGVPNDWVKTIYYGSDEDLCPVGEVAYRQLRAEMGWPPDRRIIVFIGALSDRRKGFDTLYKAWRQLDATVPWDVDLVVIGSGSEVTAWKSRVSGDNLTRRIRFLGFRSDVPRLLAACDLLVSPTRYEAYGLAVHEALCRGIPAAVTAGAGVAERFPAGLRDLLIHDPDDPSLLAQLLRQWYERRDDYSAAARAASETFRAVSWDDMARQIVLCLDQEAAHRSGA